MKKRGSIMCGKKMRERQMHVDIDSEKENVWQIITILIDLIKI
jgi:hypothetical protein